jgi:hypothetical protein
MSGIYREAVSRNDSATKLNRRDKQTSGQRNSEVVVCTTSRARARTPSPTPLSPPLLFPADEVRDEFKA